MKIKIVLADVAPSILFDIKRIPQTRRENNLKLIQILDQSPVQCLSLVNIDIAIIIRVVHKIGNYFPACKCYHAITQATKYVLVMN